MCSGPHRVRFLTFMIFSPQEANPVTKSWWPQVSCCCLLFSPHSQALATIVSLHSVLTADKHGPHSPCSPHGLSLGWYYLSGKSWRITPSPCNFSFLRSKPQAITLQCYWEGKGMKGASRRGNPVLMVRIQEGLLEEAKVGSSR
jgi:hypothetical protein